MGNTIASTFGDQASEALRAVKKGDEARLQKLVAKDPNIIHSTHPISSKSLLHAAAKHGHTHILNFLARQAGSQQQQATGLTHSRSHHDVSDARATSPSPRALHRWTVGAVMSSATQPRSPANDADALASPPTSNSRQPPCQERSGSLTGFLRRSRRASGTRARTELQTTSARQLAASASAPRGGSWLDPKDRRGITPLMMAAANNHLEFVEQLLRLGADPWRGEKRASRTALHLAAWHGHEQVVATLLKATTPTAPGGVTPPPGQRQPGDPRSLLVDIPDTCGLTPLHYAVAAGHAHVALLLLDAGANYALSNHTASHDWIVCAARSNPMHIAAERGDAVCALLLVQYFVAEQMAAGRAGLLFRVPDPRLQLNKEGFQPYMLAGNEGHWHVAQILIQISRDDHEFWDDFMGRPFSNRQDSSGSEEAAGPVSRGPPQLRQLAARAWGACLLDQASAAAAEATAQRGLRGLSSATSSHPGEGALAGRPSNSGFASSLARLAPAEQPAGASLHALSEAGSRVQMRALVSQDGSPSMAGGGGGLCSGKYGSNGGTGRASLQLASPSAHVPPAVYIASACSSRLSLSLSREPPAHAASSGGAATAVSSRQPSLSLTRSPVPAAGAETPTRPASAYSNPYATALAAGGSRLSMSTAAEGHMCDVCFERGQDVVVQPCRHPMCGGCSKGVVEMHVAQAAAPRCPFCQVDILGFAAAPWLVAAAATAAAADGVMPVSGSELRSVRR